MAKTHGKNEFVKIASTTLSGSMNTVDVDLTGEAADVTSFGESAETFIPGLSGGAINVSGFYNTTDAATILALANTTQTFENGPAGNTTGSVKLSGSCVVTSVKVTGTVREAVGLAIVASVTGGVTVGSY